MFQTRSAEAKARNAGYMLLDLALALAILLLMFAVAWPVLGTRTNGAQQAAAALDIATLFRTDRTRAARDGVATRTLIDLRERVVVGTSGHRVRVPRDIALEMKTAPRCIEGAQRVAIVFAPDGSSCGGMLTLRSGARRHVVRINWLTGMIDVLNESRT